MNNDTPNLHLLQSRLTRQDVSASVKGKLLLVRQGEHIALQMSVDTNEAGQLVLTLRRTEMTAAIGARFAVLTALNVLFSACPQVHLIQANFAEAMWMLAPLLQSGIAIVGDESSSVLCPRSSFVQHADLWLEGEPSSNYPLAYMISNGRRHPRRPPRGMGVVYQRFIPALGQTFSLRTLDAEQDLECLHRWMNNPRVAAFWQEDGDLDKHRAFIKGALDDPRNHPLIASFDGKPFAYFEAYWAKEDRIAPFYEVGDYDRGIHMLVGEDEVRGPHVVAAWLPSLLHYLFLADARTQTIVCEPRSDNARMINYLQRSGFAYRKEFDFPHKRAALLTLEREVFVAGDWFSTVKASDATK